MKKVEGLNYREWQKRNTKLFSELSRKQQKALRSEGYKNVGWLNVQKSWTVLQKWMKKKHPDMFEKRLKKGDIVGSIRHVANELGAAQKVAQDALGRIEKRQEKTSRLADEALDKYLIV